MLLCGSFKGSLSYFFHTKPYKQSDKNQKIENDVKSNFATRNKTQKKSWPNNLVAMYIYRKYHA